MLDHGSSTDSIPVFVSDGRRRHHAVRLAIASLGLLLAGWLAALAAGLIGSGPLPGLSLPGGADSRPAAVTSPAGVPKPAVSTAPSTAAPQPAGTDPKPAASAKATPSSTRTGSSTQTSTAPSGATATTGTGGSTSTQTGTGTTSTGTGGTGGQSQSNSGSEPAWTPPESGSGTATPPRGKSTTAPGTTVADDRTTLARKPTG